MLDYWPAYGNKYNILSLKYYCTPMILDYLLPTFNLINCSSSPLAIIFLQCNGSGVEN